MIEVPTNPALHLAFDAFAWVTGLSIGIVLYHWRLKEITANIARVADTGYFLSLTSGAIIGAYLSGSFTFWGQGEFALAHSVVGALTGAIIGVEIYKLKRGITISTGVIFVGPLAVGIAIGRWGCLFAGIPDQTFGVPTQLPWAVNLGDGIARHPVQVYESFSMLAFVAAFIVGLHNRSDWVTKYGFYWLAIAYGSQRFIWEFLKPYPALVGPFNHFHVMCAGLVVYGLFMIHRRHT